MFSGTLQARFADQKWLTLMRHAVGAVCRSEVADADAARGIPIQRSIEPETGRKSPVKRTKNSPSECVQPSKSRT